MAFEDNVAKVGAFREAPYDVRLLCPRCQQRMLPITYPGALSRCDNITEVCSECGLHEALVGFGGSQETTDDWPVSYMPGGLVPTRV